ncbi:MAG TPA: tRNA pseudouridine(38-40) synthase TruA [Thermoleophilia bacterium]|nr:tRNA pseudouridine(38-40) synthase TruA [Thermoleophilia bacterium]HQG02887.1 tRNA pseudouridine(38-40) synthase TruA [Thermoleophilia bacterium]HQG54736.1 tRNA pseudouridine(38-40) synthase TruA [Thermoleophilia bacterium]
MPTPPATFRLDLAYEGTRFKGWARQPGLRTVQGVVEDALATALRRRVRLSVAGRTDAGVHAVAQVASFSTAAFVCPERLLLSLNALLPTDVAVNAVTPAPPGFDARVARSRTYRYRLWLAPARPVHERAYVWHVHGALDIGLLDETAAMLVGEHDFSALTPSAHLYHHCVREVRQAVWGQGANAVERVFEITAGSFLHNMVRVAVGSMVDVAQGRMSLEAFATGLAGGRRQAMGRTAPARGLALVAVEYAEHDEARARPA